MTIYRASKVYNIPNQTLHDKINKKYKKQESAGAPTVLSSTEEGLLVKWVLHMAEIGFPVTKDQLLHSVAKLLIGLNRPNPFKDGVPGRHWYEAFLKRNPIISKRVCQALTTARVNATEEKIRGWFQRVRKYFEDNNLMAVLEDPARVFNCDESAFFLCPKGQPVLARKGVKNVHCRSGNDDKENLTLCLGASADGKLMPVLALFPYKRIPQNILLKYPKKDWAIGRTDSGWMTSEAFYEYVANQFEPFLTKENITRPVALFLDGHVSHLSLPVCEFCKEKNIILIALLPSATHALQPMDVAVFHSLKNAWSKAVHTWRMENNGKRLKREDFGPVLEKAIKTTLRPEIIQNGFRKAGLYPFDENAVNYKKIPISSAATASSSGTSTPTSLSSLESSKQLQSKDFIKWFEMNLDAHKLNEFRQCSGEWTGNVKDDSLYYFWKKTCTSHTPTPDSMSLGNTTLLENDCTLADLDLNWINEDTMVESAFLNEITLTSSLPCSTPKSPSIIETITFQETQQELVTNSKAAGDLLDGSSNIIGNISKISEQDNVSNVPVIIVPPPETTLLTQEAILEESSVVIQQNDPGDVPTIIPPKEKVANRDNDKLFKPSGTLPTNNSTFSVTTPVPQEKISPPNETDRKVENSKPIISKEALTSQIASVVQNDMNIAADKHEKCVTPNNQTKKKSSTSGELSSPHQTPIKILTRSAADTLESSPISTSQNNKKYEDSSTNIQNSVTESTPTQDQSENSQNFMKSAFPTPFKNALLWPETPSTSKGKILIKKKLAPIIGTADEYIAYEKKLKEEKEDKLKQKEIRKQVRENKAREKVKAKNIVKKNKKKSSKVPDQINEPGPSRTTTKNRESETPAIVSDERIDSNSLKITPGDYVIIIYEGENFPGVVMEVIHDASETKYKIKTMTMSGFEPSGRVNWRWPEKDDILIYDAKEVLKKIKAPTAVNKRGVFSIQSLDCDD